MFLDLCSYFPRQNKIRHRGGEDDDTINADELSELVTLDVIGFDDETVDYQASI